MKYYIKIKDTVSVAAVGPPGAVVVYSSGVGAGFYTQVDWAPTDEWEETSEAIFTGAITNLKMLASAL